MSHALQCRCGRIQGSVSAWSANRGVCYCLDCQAFAHFLGRSEEVLDEHGGSDVIQVLPKSVIFSQGIDAIACMRLTPTGLLRWYAGCCNTPIGNTLASPKISFVGLLHTCLQDTAKSLDDSFGSVRASVNTGSAWGVPKPQAGGLAKAALWFVSTTLKARLNGNYRQTPFFHLTTAAPIVAPKVLSAMERTAVMNVVHLRAASAMTGGARME